MIKVSVITPAYNSADVIAETIASVLKQDYQEWEMIIVDDGSTDGLSQVVNEFAQKDERIKLFRQANAGASAARNTGIKNSSYDWLLFLDADDWVREDYLTKMISILQDDPSIDVVHCGWARVQKDGRLSKEVYGGEQTDMFPSLAYYSPFAIHCCIVRKKIIEDIGAFDTAFKTCVDWDLWQRVARTGARFCMAKEAMAFYRTRSNSLSSNVNQFCLNGLQVISNAHNIDDRVLHPNPDYANGLQGDKVDTRKYNFITWCAGVLIGQGKEPSHLLNHLKDVRAKNLDGNLIGEILLDSLIIPAEKEHCDWYDHFQMIEDNLRTFLSGLEKQTYSSGIADEASAVIERHVISQTAQRIVEEQIGKSFAVQLDVESSIQDMELPSGSDRVIGIIKLKEKFLGLVELPVSDHVITGVAIKDAIATRFSWQILYYFFSAQVYSVYQQINKIKVTQQMHDKIGWEYFLRELWNKPGWTENMFYDAYSGKKERGRETEVNEEVNIELGEELPVVKPKSPVLKIQYYVAGLHGGEASYQPSGRLVYPQMIRAAINLSGGYEICGLVVREALIGQKMDKGLNLRQRLLIAKELRGAATAKQ